MVRNLLGLREIPEGQLVFKLRAHVSEASKGAPTGKEAALALGTFTFRPGRRAGSGCGGSAIDAGEVRVTRKNTEKFDNLLQKNILCAWCESRI